MFLLCSSFCCYHHCQGSPPKKPCDAPPLSRSEQGRSKGTRRLRGASQVPWPAGGRAEARHPGSQTPRSGFGPWQFATCLPSLLLQECPCAAVLKLPRAHSTVSWAEEARSCRNSRDPLCTPTGHSVSLLTARWSRV